MKKSIKNIFLILLLLNFASCAKRNFYADVDDPGLSRFTSYGYNNATEYINGSAYINPFSVFSGNDLASVQKIITNSSFDTLSISWGITTNDSSKPFNPDYRAISFLMPISKIFTENDFLAFNGRRFASDTITVTMELFNNTSFKILSGTANIYFVKVNIDNSGAEKRFAFSGLCNGNIGDSILITKGRFDFDVPATNFNF